MGILDSTSLKKTNHIVIQKLSIEKKKPNKEESLKGRIENPVAICDHKLKSFKVV